TAVAMEVMEDDVFFADLSKRISLLIMDDDEGPLPHYPSVSFQAFSKETHPTTQSQGFHEQAYRRESKGTGVFIPRSAHPRRKSKPGRYNSANTKFQKQYPDDNNSRGLPHVAYSTDFTRHDSFCPKRC
ncbi:hypothetical protein RJ639_009926, partial [Escallonia herrerae]